MSPRILLLQPHLPAGAGGGLTIALDDLRLALEEREWTVDCPRFVTPDPASNGHAPGESHAHESILMRLHGFPRFVANRGYIPHRARRWALHLAQPRGALQRASALLREAEAHIRRTPYDIVLACPDAQPPGLLHLATHLHPRVIAITLAHLAEELRYRQLWTSLRATLSLRKSLTLHPALGRPVMADRLSHAVFASDRWREEGVRSGVPLERTSAIYFGVDAPPLRECRPWRDQLLWAGRLSPEKGLHELLRAWPAIRRHRPDATLTAVAAPGPKPYASLIRSLTGPPAANGAAMSGTPIGASGTTRATRGERGTPGGVTMLGAQPRAALQDIYRSHDALIFYSASDEPVALVVLEAFAAGLPVIAARPRRRQGPLREDETCLCFDRRQPATLARAVERLAGDTALRTRLVARAHQVAQEEYSRNRMGDAYDGLLRFILRLHRPLEAFNR